MKIAVITGDVIQSSIGADIWIDDLEKSLEHWAIETGRWQMYRGDSFQIEVSADIVLRAAMGIRASLRKNHPLDARIGIGIGDQQTKHPDVTRSSGSAYTRSGRAFEELNGGRWQIDCGSEEENDCLNVMLELANLTIERWKPEMARTMETYLKHVEENQNQLAQRLNKSQSTVNVALIASGYSELMRMDSYFRRRIAVI